jgi:hypothetical protein
VIRSTALLALAILLVQSSVARADEPPAISPSRFPTSGAGHLDRSGMNEHAFRGFFEGLFVGTFLGFAISSSTSDSNAAIRMVTGGLIGAGLGVGLPLWLNRGKEVRSGDVVFLNAAQNWGFVNGFAVPLLFQMGSGTFDDEVLGIERPEARLDFGLSAVVSLAAGGLAAYAAPTLDLTPGQAAMVGTTSLWAGLGGLLLVYAISPDNAGTGWNQAKAASIIIGSTGGALAALTLRETFEVDRGRAVMVDLGAVVGLGAGALLGWFLDPDFENQHAVFGSLLAGMLAGNYFGWLVSRGMDDYKLSAPREPTTALINYRDGAWIPGVPTPRPLAVRTRTGRSDMVAGVSLLDGRF